MVRIPRDEMEERLLETQRQLLRNRTTIDAALRIQAKFGVNRRTALRYCAEVRARWRDEEKELGTDERFLMRREAAESFRDVYVLAASKFSIKTNPDGTVALDAKGEPIRVPNPDFRTMLRARGEIVRLYGLAEAIKIDATVKADVETSTDLAKLTAEQRYAFEAYLKTMAPNGDISALAGEQFRLSGEEK